MKCPKLIKKILQKSSVPNPLEKKCVEPGKIREREYIKAMIRTDIKQHVLLLLSLQCHGVKEKLFEIKCFQNESQSMSRAKNNIILVPPCTNCRPSLIPRV